VLASWLFAQYLLSNEVQIGYAMTEGYVPVTSKAQDSTEYQDYLSRGGQDNENYYDVKIKASKLLLENTENTFVTPVFNGSASLRNAAGQMIENVAKSVRRKETVDDAYMDELYTDMIALYRLNTDGQGVSPDSKTNLGPLPGTAVALLAILAIIWICIGLYIGIDFYKKKRKSINSKKD